MTNSYRISEKVKAMGLRFRKFNDKEQWCNDCKKWLPLNSFHKNRCNPSGRQNTCIECHTILREKRDISGAPASYWNEQRNLQNNCCAICQRPFIKGNAGRRAERDHDHKTNRPRGILCGQCNRWLGHAESLTVLQNAVTYLQKYAANPSEPVLSKRRGAENRPSLVSKSEDFLAQLR